MSSSIPEPVRGLDMVLTGVARTLDTQGSLNNIEKLMATSATAAKTAEQYGPRMGNIELEPIPLPEAVKGILAQYMS